MIANTHIARICVFCLFFITTGYDTVDENGDISDISNETLNSCDPTLKAKIIAMRVKFEKKLNEINETAWKAASEKFENATQYMKFQCAIGTSLHSIDRIWTDAQRFQKTEAYRRKFSTRSIDKEYMNIVNEIIARLTPKSKQETASRNAQVLWNFISFSDFKLSENIRKFFSNRGLGEKHYIHMAATLQSVYYLFCQYVRGMPTIQAYIKNKMKEGKPVSLRHLLEDKNYWPFRLKDLNYINVLRNSLDPKEFQIGFLPIKKKRNETWVMPLSEPECDPSDLVFT